MKPTKMNGQSKDPREEVVKYLKENLPEIWSEGRVDCRQLKAVLGDLADDGQERYGLSWAGKSECFRHIQEPTTMTLKPDREESVDFDNTRNIFIEGDNLQALKVLQKSYYGKIKMIYIDPPYNTGSDSFIYPDRFQETQDEYMQRVGDKDEEGNLTRDGMFRKNSKENGHYHSNWLNMMYPRLFLARNLLRQDGVIFVSIDDNEVFNLRMMMNEIFGEENFVTEFAWRRTDNQPNIGSTARVKEYVICYARNISYLKLNKMKLTERALKEYRYSDNSGSFRRAILIDKTRGRHYYKIKTPRGRILNGPWMIREDEFRKLEVEDGLYWTNGSDEQPYGKIYLRESEGQIPNDFLGIEFGTNQQASVELEELFGKRFFDFPKPISLIKHFTIISTNDEDIILDFFSGSATTAHAVMELNAEDGGNRRCISIQLPELCDEGSEAFKAGYKTIADIGRERIRRAGEKLRGGKSPLPPFAKGGESFQSSDASGGDFGFKAFKLDESNFKIWHGNIHTVEELMEQLEMFVDNVLEGSAQENILYELILKSGLDLNIAVEKREAGGFVYYVLGQSSQEGIVVCLEQGVNEELIDAVSAAKPASFICLDRAFKGNDQLKTNAALQFEREGIDFKVI